MESSFVTLSARYHAQLVENAAVLEGMRAASVPETMRRVDQGDLIGEILASTWALDPDRVPRVMVCFMVGLQTECHRTAQPVPSFETLLGDLPHALDIQRFPALDVESVITVIRRRVPERIGRWR